jgi:hypothetical protein
MPKSPIRLTSKIAQKSLRIDEDPEAIIKALDAAAEA